MRNEFKTFISRGNVVDLAVGVIIGGAFGKIVSSLVDDVLMPVVGTLLGGFDFSSLAIQAGTARIAYGNFIQNIFDFLIIAICVFVLVKFINKIHFMYTEPSAAAVSDKKLEKTENQELAVLKEIRDSLKKK
ncbi:MAG: large-conductance mechanosensitive channel protein MscL [Candidatus Nomurabacteria bacterium]|nr:large-conductance mechanosensitive channel protein MscL [Candidatus Nomurabacteria bacterium]